VAKTALATGFSSGDEAIFIKHLVEYLLLLDKKFEMSQLPLSLFVVYIFFL